MIVKLYAALDVSLEKIAVCVMDQDGRVVREFEVTSCPDSLAQRLAEIAPGFERIGLEAGPMSEWLVRGLAERGMAAVLMDTRQVRTALSSMRAKTDRNDARGMAHLLRMGGAGSRFRWRSQWNSQWRVVPSGARQGGGHTRAADEAGGA